MFGTCSLRIACSILFLKSEGTHRNFLDVKRFVALKKLCCSLEALHCPPSSSQLVQRQQEIFTSTFLHCILGGLARQCFLH